MAVSYLRYALQDRYIHNWLVGGPQTLRVTDPALLGSEIPQVEIAETYHMPDSGITATPVERGPLSEGTFKVGDYEGAWAYRRCQEDHLVDLSDIYPRMTYLRAWAYVELNVEVPQEVSLVLTTHGPADLWVNETHVRRVVHFEAQAKSISTAVDLTAGRNAILVRFEQVAAGACAYAMALQLIGLDADKAEVTLPTTIRPLERRNRLEEIFEAAYLDQAVYERDDEIRVHWQALDGRWAVPMTILLRSPTGRIHAETPLEKEEGEEQAQAPEKGALLGQPFQYPEGFYRAILMPPIPEYGERNMRITRELPLWALDNNTHSDTFYGKLAERRVEALRHAARFERDLYAEVAKMAIGWWSRVDQNVVLQAAERVADGEESCLSDLLGLLGMFFRFESTAEFPETLKGTLDPTILEFDYQQTEPNHRSSDWLTGSQQLLLHTCELLAGQRYPDHTFGDSGEDGRWHRQHGQKLVMAWLRERAAGGFEAWDSDIAFAEMLAALIHLEEFAEDDATWEMATAMLDKLLFTLAVNSHKGIYGTTQGHTEVPQILHGMLGATAGISRLMWGMGAFNHHTLGTVSLACAENYGFPRLIQAIATDLPEEMWSRERHAPDSAQIAVDKVIYRTPDYMLSSTQDHRPGEPGGFEHIWQATMGPAAVVFVNHPACASLDEARRPNYWRGNASLPRVAQWQDVLVAVHVLPDDDWMGFTHAYFPAHAFDAHELRDGWAFAQKGKAYLALTAAQGLQWITTGLHAYRELRSYGRHNIWVCQMGREAVDGSFAQFQDAVLARDLTFEDRNVRLGTLRGETLAFGWEGPLMRDGEAEPISGFHHFESPYGGATLPAEELVIMFAGQAMRLNLK